jgi:hypothetical protein
MNAQVSLPMLSRSGTFDLELNMQVVNRFPLTPKRRVFPSLR